MEQVFLQLTRVFPNREVISPEALRIMRDPELSYEAKVQKILSNYFDKQRQSCPSSIGIDDIIRIQAMHMHKLFPSVDLQYIEKQLNLYRDMPDRKIIVLRQLVFLKEENVQAGSLKRELPVLNKLNEPAQKMRKVNCTITTTSLMDLTYLEGESSSSKNTDTLDVHDFISSLDNIMAAQRPTETSFEDFEPPVGLLEGNGLSGSTETSFKDFETPAGLLEGNAVGLSGSTEPVQSGEKVSDSQSSGQTEIYPFENYMESPDTIDTNLPQNYTVGTSEQKANWGTQDYTHHKLPTEHDYSVGSSSSKDNKTQVFPFPAVTLANSPVEQGFAVDLCSGFSVPQQLSLGVESGHSNFLKDFNCITDNQMATNSSAAVTIMDPSNSKPKKPTKSIAVTERGKTDLTSSLPYGISSTISVSLDSDSADSDVLELKPEVAGSDSQNNSNVQLVNSLCSMFPEACPNYIRKLCKGLSCNPAVLDRVISIILDTNENYPKRSKPVPEPEVVPENQLEILKELLPDADPDYLNMMCDKFEGKPQAVREFINEAMETRNYPKMQEYLRRQKLSSQQKQYLSEFKVENFIKVIPDPEKFFSDPSRKVALSVSDCHYTLVFLRNKFNKLPLRFIQSTFQKLNNNVGATVAMLEKSSAYAMKSTRKPIRLPTNVENIPLLQELAYHTHKEEINAYIQLQKKKEEEERLEVKKQGLMHTCNCCYDEEVLPRDVYRCENGCEFCKDCVVKSSEVIFGEGKLTFPCLMNCSAVFSLHTLQTALSPKLFSRIAQKKALEEIKSAGIEELVYCPFCDFATIIPDGYNIFPCMNPECMKESCRMCKEPSHVPLRCDEVEKDADVKARVFVENKMTEALLRKCYKCGIQFFKEEGCNKMTCSCGAMMCYVCGKAVTDYKHFNGNGGDRFDLCPLYSDTNVLNKENVLKGAEAAKAQIGNVSLKHDPTADINSHYQERSRLFPQNHLMVGQINQRVDQAMRVLLEPVNLVQRAHQARQQQRR